MNRIKNIFLGISLLGLSSCSDFLDEVPDNRVEIDTVDKAGQLVGNAYNQAAYLFTDWMSDNSGNLPSINGSNANSDAYRWEKPRGTGQDTPDFFWNGAYEAIAHSNEVLARIDELYGDDDKRAAVKGEALVTRAYNHFLLVSLYSKMYNQATAGADLGIPYVEEPERVLIKHYERGTVQEAYDKIERDLMEGMELLNDRFYSGSKKYHFTRKAALAFATRFYLFKGDFDNVLLYSNQLLGENPGSYVRDMHHVYATQNGGTHLAQLLSSPEEEANLLLQYKHTFYRTGGSHGYGVTSRLNRQIFNSGPLGGTDPRLGIAFDLGSGAGVLYPKYESLLEKESLAAETGYPTTVMVELKGEEVLFNRMEALLYLWRVAIQADNEEARSENINQFLSDMNMYLAKRYTIGAAKMELHTLRLGMAAGLSITIPDDEVFTPEQLNQIDGALPDVLLSMVLAEKRKEFIQEGMRWWDNLRFGIEIKHVTASGEELVLPANDAKRVLQIPRIAIDLGITANPR